MRQPTVSHGPLEELRAALETLVECIPPVANPDLTESVRGFLAAINYKDDALLRSRYEDLGAAFADTADKAIRQAELWVERARDICRKTRSLNGPPSEQFDELGRILEGMFDRLQEDLLGIKQGWLRLAQECDQEVPRADVLDLLIRDLDTLRENTLTGWPWTSLGLPPVDRKMVARSRAAYARGEGELLQDWLSRAANHPVKG